MKLSMGYITYALAALSSSRAFAPSRFVRSVAAATAPTSLASKSVASLPTGGRGRGGVSASLTAAAATATEEVSSASVQCSTKEQQGQTTRTSTATTAGAAYEELTAILSGITHLSRASAVLNYDQMVFMPQTEAASLERGKQSAALAAVIHEKSTDPRIGELIEQAEKEEYEKDFDQTSAAGSNVNDHSDRRRVVELARRAYNKKVRIPTDLASRRAALSSEAYNVWAKARAADDYGLFRDIFEQCIEVSKETAAMIQTDDDRASGKSLYATMLDDFEVGMDPDRIDQIFEQIQNALVPLIDKVLDPTVATPPNKDPLYPVKSKDSDDGKGGFAIDKQEALSKQLVRAIGFDDGSGRIDVSVHPFTSGISKHDVRITSRFSKDEWYQGLAGSIHEAGHAMYEQNVGDSGLPVDEALSMGMHESQSLFWERHIGLSRPFWEYAAPVVNKHLKTAHDADALHTAVNAVERSLIRVEADELTYPLHIILRYKIERDFVDGRLDVRDIPARWNEDMKSLLKVDVPTDAKGCLQDVHWSMLAYGYFPTYLIGAASAAQLAHYCRRDITDFDERVAAGDFGPIKAWLTEKVHRHGSRYRSLDEHLEAQLDEALNPQYFIDYLTAKYTELYQC